MTARYPVVDQPMPNQQLVLCTLLEKVHACRVDELQQEVLEAIENATIEDVADIAAAVACALADDKEQHVYLRGVAQAGEPSVR